MLESVLPRAEILSSFDKQLYFLELGVTDIDKLASLQPDDVIQMGMTIWNRIVVEHSDPVDPMQLSAVADYDEEHPQIHIPISDIIGKKVLFDLYYCNVEINDGSLTDRQVAEIFVAHIYPNNLMIGDVLFQNPYCPLKKKERKSSSHTHHGLGLLPKFIDLAKSVASNLKCNNIVLVAASMAECKLFNKYGFVIEESPAGRNGVRLGVSIPMQLSLV